MSKTLSTSSGPLIPSPTMFDPRYVKELMARKEAAERLTQAIFEYLTVGIDEALEDANRKPPRPPRPTIEDLNRAQEDLDMAHQQLAALDALADGMPTETGEYFRVSQKPTIQRMVAGLEERVSKIQQALEEPEDSPWDGSHHIGTLCAQCARPYEGVEHSIQALKIALKSAGWGRDADGDHICSGCVAVNADRAKLVVPAPKGESE
jgi:hypothetical protein